MTKIPVDGLAEAVCRELNAFADTTSANVKAAVRKAAGSVRKEIEVRAPRRTGRYAQSWKTRATKETSQSLEMTVYSPKRYMLTHLLEHGHAKRNGGRVEGREHIASAERKGVAELEAAIERSLRHG